MAAQQQDTETDEFEQFELLVKSNKALLSFSVLNLSNQNFTNTPHGYLLAGFVNLKTLNLSANQIVRFNATNLLEGAPNLQDLDLSKNKINSLEDILKLGHSKTLNKLDFTENPISNQFLRIKLVELLLFPSKYRKYDPVKVFTANYGLSFSNVTMKRRPDIVVNKTGNSFREAGSLIPLDYINESSFVKFTKDPCPIPRRTHFPVLTNLNGETITVLDLQGILVSKDLSEVLTDKNQHELQKSVRLGFKKLHEKLIKNYTKRKTQRKEELYDVPSLHKLALLLQDENDLRLIFLFDQIAREKRKKTPLDYEEIMWQGPADKKIKDSEDFTIGISELNEMTKAHEELTEMRVKAKEISSGERIKSFRKAFLELREESAIDVFSRESVDPKKKKVNKKEKKKQHLDDLLEQQLKTPEKKNDISMTVTSNASVNEELTVDEHGGGNNLFHLTNEDNNGEFFEFDKEEEEEGYEGGESPFIFGGRQSKSNSQTLKEPESSQSNPVMVNFADRTTNFRVRSQSLTKFDKTLAKIKKVNFNQEDAEKTPDSFMQMPILKLIKHAQSFAPEDIKMSTSITESSKHQQEDSKLVATTAAAASLRKTVFVARESTPNISVPLYVQKNPMNKSSSFQKLRPTTAAVDKFSNSQSQASNNNYKTFTLNQTYENQSSTENLELRDNNIGHISERKIDFSSVEDSKLKTINPLSKTNNHNQSSLETLVGKMNERTNSFVGNDEKETFKVQDMINDQKKKKKEGLPASHQDEVRESNQSRATPLTRLQSAMGGERNSGQNFRSSYSNFFNTNEGFINKPINVLPLSESNSNIVSLKKDSKERTSAPVSSRVPPSSSQSIMNPMKTHYNPDALKSNEARIVEKSYLRLLVSKIKAQKIRENEQKTLKKTKQDVLLRANSSQIAVRPNKNARSASNPAIRGGEETVPNFKIYAYQNVSNPQEKERKALINQICSKITQENFFKSKPQKATLKIIANPASARQPAEETKIPVNVVEPKRISEYGGQFFNQFPDDADHSPPRRLTQHYQTIGPKTQNSLLRNQSGDQRWSTIRRAELFNLNNSIQQQSFSINTKNKSFSTVHL